MNKEAFIQDVQEEIDGLRNSITPKQRDQLDPKKYNRKLINACIYGLLELHDDKTTKRLYRHIHNPNIIASDGEDVPFKEHSFKEHNPEDDYIRYYVTSLEKYLFMIPLNNQLEIIKYIKGETNEIDLHII